MRRQAGPTHKVSHIRLWNALGLPGCPTQINIQKTEGECTHGGVSAAFLSTWVAMLPGQLGPSRLSTHAWESTDRDTPTGPLAGSPGLDGIRLMAYSASAVIVRLGFTPGLAGTMEPSTTYKPG